MITNRFLLICAVLWLSSPVRELSSADQLDADLAWLAEQRQALHQALDRRLQNDHAIEPGVELRLHLPRALRYHGSKVRTTADHSGIVFEDADVVLRRGGGRWLGTEVTGLSSGLGRRFHLHAADCRDLTWSDGRLRGDFTLQTSRRLLRRDMHGGVTFHHLPPEEMPVPNWTLGGAYRVHPFTQRFSVAFDDTNEAGWRLRLDLPDGIKWRGRTGDTRKLLQCEVRMDAEGYAVTSWGRSPTWNKGGHRSFIDRITVNDQQLTAELRVVLRPDRWVGGRIHEQTYSIALPIDASGRFAGTIQSSGSLGDFSCQGSGQVGRWRWGSYQTAGPDGERGGKALLEVSGVDQRTAPLPELAIEPAARLRQLRDDLAALLQARAVYPRAWETLHQTGLAWALDDRPARTAAAAGLRRQLTRALIEGDTPHSGIGPIEDGRFGPWFGEEQPLAESRLDPADDQQQQRWQYLDDWQVLGPVPLRESHAPLSEVQPGVALVDDAWRAHRAESAWFLPGFIAEDVAGRRAASFSWYAATTVTCSRAGLWHLALPAHSEGALWIDGRLVWHGDASADGLQTAVLPVQLDAGPHEIVIRAGMRGMKWGGHGSSNTDGRMKLAQAHVGLAIATAGVPAGPASQPATPGPAAVAIGTPPLAWSLDAGKNVRWDVTVPGGLRRLVALDQCLVVVTGDRLSGLDLADGRELWQATPTVGRLSHPVVLHDGVAVLGGDGTLICLSADGRERWRLATPASWEPSSIGTGLLLSRSVIPQPILVGDALVLESLSEQGRRYVCISDDGARQRWSIELPGKGLGAVGAVLGACPILVTPAGEIIDLRSGTVTHRDLTGLADGPVPVSLTAQGDGYRAIWLADGQDQWIGGWRSGWKAGADIWLAEDGRVGARFLWRSKGPSRFGGPPAVVHGDYIFTNRCNTGHHQEGPAPYSKLHVIDRRTGALLADVNPLLDVATAPKSLHIAGGRLYAGDAGGKQAFNSNQIARMAVTTLGEHPLVIAENIIPTGWHEPLFVGDAICLAGDGRLVCLAVDGEPGRQWQYQRVAQTMLARLGSKPVDPTERRLRPTPMASPADPRQVPIQRFKPRTVPAAMLGLGPFADAVPVEALQRQGLGDAAGIPTRDSSWTLAGKEFRFRPADRGQIRYAGTNWQPFGNEYRYGASWILDLWPVLERQTESAAVLTAVWRVDKPGVYRFQAKAQSLRVWMGGVELEHGDIVELEPGDYTYHILVQVGRLPKFLRERKLIAKVYFSTWLGVEERTRRWLRQIRLQRAMIEEVVAVVGDTPFGGQLANMLKLLDEQE